MQGTAWTAVVEALLAERVRYVFGLPGNPRHLLQDLSRQEDIEFVLMRHEVSAVAAAAAYARISGRPGIVFSNPGPGIAQLVTNLLEATSASVPVIAIANGVVAAADGKGAFQELDSLALMRPVTKWATRVTSIETMPWVMRRAFDRAVNGRPGAVFIELPSDLALRKVELAPYAASMGRHRSRADPEAIAAASRLLVSAERPLFLCGSGAVSASASDAMRDIAESLAVPVFVSPGGRGTYPEDGPMFLGLTGLYATSAGSNYFKEADLVISVGSRLEAFTTQSWSIMPDGARFIQIDIDPEVIGMNWQPDVALVGDAALVLHDLLAELDSAPNPEGVDARARRIATLRQGQIAEAEAQAGRQETPIRPPQVLAAVNKVFGHDTILVKENGGADLWCYYWPHYQVLDVGDCVPMGEQTNMGWGVVGTIGAKLARPDKKVVCFAGDGAMQMAMHELATAAERRLGITWVVLNNKALGWVQYTQVLLQQEHYGTGFKISPDFAAIAEAQGCKGFRVTKPDEVDQAIKGALRANEAGVPALVDVAIAAHDYTPDFVAAHKRAIGLAS